MKFIKKTIEEKETIIEFDYEFKRLNIYSTRNATIKILQKKLGTPKNQDTIDGQIYSAEWEIDFQDRKRIKKGLAMEDYMR